MRTSRTSTIPDIRLLTCESAIVNCGHEVPGQVCLVPSTIGTRRASTHPGTRCKLELAYTKETQHLWLQLDEAKLGAAARKGPQPANSPQRQTEVCIVTHNIRYSTERFPSYVGEGTGSINLSHLLPEMSLANLTDVGCSRFNVHADLSHCLEFSELFTKYEALQAWHSRGLDRCHSMPQRCAVGNVVERMHSQSSTYSSRGIFPVNVNSLRARGAARVAIKSVFAPTARHESSSQCGGGGSVHAVSEGLPEQALGDRHQLTPEATTTASRLAAMTLHNEGPHVNTKRRSTKMTAKVCLYHSIALQAVSGGCTTRIVRMPATVAWVFMQQLC